jgi:hypothetical protein
MFSNPAGMQQAGACKPNAPSRLMPSSQPDPLPGFGPASMPFSLRIPHKCTCSSWRNHYLELVISLPFLFLYDTFFQSLYAMDKLSSNGRGVPLLNSQSLNLLSSVPLYQQKLNIIKVNTGDRMTAPQCQIHC